MDLLLSFHEDLVMKIFLQPLILEKKLSFNGENIIKCALNTGNLLLRGLPRNSDVMITECPNITLKLLIMM